jgi:hypothetical protein
VARRHQRIRRARRVGRGGRAGISVSVAPGVSGAAGAASGAPLRSSGSARRAFFCACGVVDAAPSRAAGRIRARRHRHREQLDILTSSAGRRSTRKPVVIASQNHLRLMRAHAPVELARLARSAERARERLRLNGIAQCRIWASSC